MRERENKTLVSICFYKGKREKPQNGSLKKKSHQRAQSHHHPNNNTTGERTSFACKNIMRFIQICAFRSRSTFAKKPNSRHHFCANQTVSLTSARVKALRTQRKSTRREKERNKRFIFANARSPLSLSIHARTRFVRSFRTSRSLERERDRERDARRETYHDEFCVFLRANFMENATEKKTTKKGRRHECISVFVPHTNLPLAR